MAKTPAKAAAQPKPGAAKPQAVVDENVVEVPEGSEKAGAGMLRLKDLIEQVVTATGAKPKDAREIVGATLMAMGAALDRRDGLILPDFGKGRIARSTPGADGEVAFVLKLRRGGTQKKKEEKEALAEGSE